MKHILSFTLISLTAALLTACGGGQIIGSKAPPDELAVIEGPSLALPPDYDLRPPQDGEGVEESLVSDTDEMVFGVGKPAAPADPADSWLLKKTGATKADPRIRAKLTQEQKVIQKEEKKGWFTKKKEELFGGNEEAKTAEELSQE